jgi:hypothetical protein
MALVVNTANWTWTNARLARAAMALLVEFMSTRILARVLSASPAPTVRQTTKIARPARV